MRFCAFFFFLLCCLNYSTAQVWQESEQFHYPLEQGNSGSIGRALDIEGDFAIIGAGSDETGLLGQPEIDDAGSARIFEQVDGVWEFRQKLVASDRLITDNFSQFGYVTAISGNYAAVSATDQVYIFERDASGFWSETQIITTPGPAFDRHGLDMAGDVLVIAHDRVDTDQNDENFLDQSGAVFCYRKDAQGVFQLTQKLVAEDRQANDLFGFSVSMSGSRILVGAQYQDYDEAGLSFLEKSGAAYVFEEQADGSFLQSQKLVTTQRLEADRFGFNVAIDGDRLVVQSKALSQSLPFVGALHIFELDQFGVWQEVQNVTANNPVADQDLGWTLDMKGDQIIAGAPQSNPTSVHVFSRDGQGEWFEEQVIGEPIESANTWGWNVAIGMESLLVVGTGNPAIFFYDRLSALEANCASGVYNDTLALNRKGSLWAKDIVFEIDGNELYEWYNSSGQLMASFTGIPFYAPTEIGSYYVQVSDPDFPNCIQVLGPREIEGLDGCCELEDN